MPVFANAVSNASVPNRANTNMYIPINSIDNTTNFSINVDDSTKLVADTSGNWQFVLQIQLVGINNASAKQSELDGFLAINGKPIAGSDATQSTLLNTETNVLTIAGIASLAIGDYVQFGIRSSTGSNGILPNVSSNCFMGFGAAVDGNPVYAPSTILTATRLHSSCVQTGSYTPYTDGLHRIVFDRSTLMTQINGPSGEDLTIDSNGNLKATREGVYYLCAQFQLVGLKTVSTSSTSSIGTTEVDGFYTVTRNNTELSVPNSMASNNAVQAGQTNVLPISITLKLKANDVVKVYANVGSNVSVSGFMAKTGVYAPSVIFTAISVADDAQYMSIGSTVNYLDANTTSYINFTSGLKIYNPFDPSSCYASGLGIDGSGAHIVRLNDNSPGRDYFIACQYQLYAQRSLNPAEAGNQAQLDGWLEVGDASGVNWSPIASSDAACSLHYEGEWLVLFIAGAVHLTVGQRVRFACNSHNTNQSAVSVLQKADASSTIPAAPSVILTIYEIKPPRGTEAWM